MADVFATLEAFRDQLATISGVATCKIGLEANMTPADYPMIRIVPGKISNGPGMTRRTTEALVYFGQPIHEFSAGLESQWQSLLAMESVLLSHMRPVSGVTGVRYIETVLDEDRIDAYKLLAIRCEISG